MKPFNKLFLLASVIGLSFTSLYGAEPEGKTVLQEDIEENEFEDALLNFINGKRNIPIEDKSENLTIAGEVHFKWNHHRETIRGHNVRTYNFLEDEDWGNEFYEKGDFVRIGPNDFEAQLDIFMDWKGERSWVRTALRYNNSAGVADNGWDRQIDPQGYHGSGILNSIQLREAFIGYEIFNQKDNRLIMEIGRRGQLCKILSSEIAFNSRFDGVNFKFASKNGGGFVQDWYVTAAAFVVDWRSDYYAWAIEIGANNILDTGLDLKYAFVDWDCKGENRFFVNHPIGLRFKVSQWSFNYELDPEWCGGYPVSFFGGFLMNHIPSKYVYVRRAPPKHIINPKPKDFWKPKKIGRQNLGAFLCAQLNEIEHEGDWYASLLLGYCEAQCIPDNDVRNIGTGNYRKESITAFGRGNTNWKGYCLSGGYAVTDNWVIESQYNHSWNIKNIAGSHSFRKFTLESNYSF